MENFKNLRDELIQLERDGRLLKQVHHLRKAVIWKKIAEIAVKQEKYFFNGMEANKVIDYGKNELDFLLNRLGDEIQNFKDERKKIKARSDELVKKISAMLEK